MKLNIKELLDFFDDKKNSRKGDANALMAMLGEDLNASAYEHFRKNEIEILEEPISQGFRGGKQLDRWILDKKNKKLFQCEIKNWSAGAINGKRLACDATDEEIKRVVKHYWGNELKQSFSNLKEQPNGVTKVLLKMRPPEDYKNISKIEPLLIYWMPISPNEKEFSPFSTIYPEPFHLPIHTEFSELHIFSVSLYLRQLYKKGKGKKFIDLDMPHFEHRIKILTKFQNKKCE